MGMTVADLKVKFSGDTKDAEKSIDSLNSKLNDVGKGSTAGLDALGNKLKNIGGDAAPGASGSLFGNLFANAAAFAIGDLLSSAIKTAARLGWDGAKAIFNAGLGEIKTTIKIGLDYQQDLANIQADLTNLNPSLALADGSFDAAKAKELADIVNRIALDPKLVVGFKDTAIAAQTLTRYGYTLKDLNNGMLESTVLLQNAQGGSFQLAAETLAKYQAIHNLKPEDANKSVSEISATISVGNFRDLNDYRYAMVNATGIAQDFNLTQLDTNAALAINNKLFASGRTDGTAWRVFMEHLVPATNKASDAMQALNLTFFDANGNYVGYTDTLSRLRNAFSGLTQKEKEAKIADIFGATGGKYARAVLSDLTDAELDHAKALIDGADATKSAGVRTDTLAAKLGNLGDQFEALRGKFFSDELQHVFFGPVEALQNLATSIGPTFEGMGQRAATALQPLANIATRLISGKGLGNFSAVWNSSLGKIKVLKMGDLFSFDIGDIGATFQQGLANFHIGQWLEYSAIGNDSYKIKLSKFITFENDLGSGFKQLDIGKFFHLSTDDEGKKKHLNINNFVIFNEEEGKRSLEIGKFFKVAENTIKGTVDLQVGTFKTTIDVAALRTKIEIAVGAVGLILSSIPAKLTEFFSSGSLSQGFSFTATDSPFMAALKSIPAKIQAEFASFSIADITLPDIATKLKDKIKGLFPADFTFSLPSIDGIRTTFSSITTVVDGFNASLKGLTAGDGGITKLQTMFLGALQGISAAISGVDENKVASVGISFSSAITSLLGVFTTLSNLGNDNVSAATTGISNLVKSILGLATSFTSGLNITQISEAAAKFAGSFVDEITKVLGSADLPGIASAAGALLTGITTQFSNAMKGDATKTLGASFGGLASTIVTQLGAVFNDKTLAANLGQSFSNIIVGLTNGLKGAFDGFNAADSTKDVNIQGAITGFITSFLDGIDIGLKSADYSSIFKSFFEGLFKSLSGIKDFNKALEENANATGIEKINTLIRVVEAFKHIGDQGFNGDPAKLTGNGGGFGGAGDKKFFDGIIADSNKPITTQSVTVNADSLKSSDIGLGGSAMQGYLGGFLDKLERGVVSLVAPLIQGRAAQNAAGAGATVGGGVLANVPQIVTLDQGSVSSVGQSVASAVNSNLASLNKPSQYPTAAEFGAGKNIDAATIQANSVVVTGANGGLGAGVTPQTPPVPPFQWPPLPTFAWPTFSWPSLPTFSWPPMPGFTWPAFPPFTWPAIPQPAWMASLLNWHPTVTMPSIPTSVAALGFAGGTKFAPGGWAWVGEQGPELLRLPRGAQVMSNTKSMDAIGQLADGNYAGPYAPGNYFGSHPSPLATKLAPPIGGNSPFAPITKHLANIDKASASTALESKLAARQRLVKGATGNPIEAERARRANPATAATEAARRAQGEMPASVAFAAMLKSQQEMGREIAKSFQGTVEEFKSFLQSVPGLFKTSSVTQGDMDAAKSGTYKEKVDEKVRQLQDLAEHGVSYAGLNVQEFKDALGRIGVKASDDLKTLTTQVKSAWDDQSLFADKKNLGLLNLQAVKDSMAQQAQQKAGAANIMALFGIEPAAAQAQAVAAGAQVRTGLQQGLTGLGAVGKDKAGAAVAGQPIDILSGLLSGAGAGITPEAIAPLAEKFKSALASAFAPQKDKDGNPTGVDFGAQIAGAITASLTDSKSFDTVGSAILKKITDGWATITGVDFVGGITKAFDAQLITTDAIDSLKAIGGKIGAILKDGIAEYFKTADLAAAVGSGVASATTTPTVGANAGGTDYWKGGLSWVGERGKELINLPRGSQVIPHDRSMALAGGGGGGDIHVHINATVDNRLDIKSLAYDVAQEIKRRGGR